MRWVKKSQPQYSINQFVVLSNRCESLWASKQAKSLGCTYANSCLVFWWAAMDTKWSPIRNRATNNDDTYASSFFSILVRPRWIEIALTFKKGPNILIMHDRFSCSIAGKKMHMNRSASQDGLKSTAVCTTGTVLASHSDSDGLESLPDSKSAKNHACTYAISFFDIAAVLMDMNCHLVQNEVTTGSQNGCVSLWAQTSMATPTKCCFLALSAANSMDVNCYQIQTS